MAGLNCEIRWETRLCEVDGELGYFHCWEHWSNVIDASPLRGGHPGGQIGQVYGIVEFTDGVRRVDPSKIKFCDEENALLTEMGKHMKVCILSNDDPAAFQSSINAFIADKKVIDIKYQSMNLTLKFTNGVPSESIIVDRALIIYEE